MALTLPQIEEHTPPPQYAKPTDARYVKYVAEHGTEDVWELDSLPPDVLAEIATDAILYYLPEDYEEIKAEADLRGSGPVPANWVGRATSEPPLRS